jgi:outer membrane immunogenic protein
MRIRLFVPALAAATAFAAPAFAQSGDWSGFYVGANLGGSWGDTSMELQVAPGSGATVIPPGDVGLLNQVGSDDDNKTSLTGGLQAGFNFQSGGLILGLETDIGFLDVDQERTNVYQSQVAAGVAYALDQRVKTDWIWTLRPRLGYASGPWMGYVTGGIATTKTKFKTTLADNRAPANVAVLERSDTDTGWVGGLGGAYALSESLSLRGEWLYVDFGKVHETVATPNGFIAITPEAKVKANLLRVGLDYRF